MLTAEIITSLAPRAREDYVAALVNGANVLDSYSINTPLRLAAFMATISHETGGLTIVRESFNYKSKERIAAVWPTRPEAQAYVGQPVALANMVYGSRMGNQKNGTADDDGWRYRGGGLIQLTGKDSYAAAGSAIGVDLGNHPELIEEADVSLKAACWEFSKFTDFCDKGESGFRAVCNGINRGNALSKLDPIGWMDRQQWYQRWSGVLVNGKPADDTLSYGDQGALVKAIQTRLASLGYAIGRADGVYGSRTRSAILAFQAENGLVTDGKIGPQTRAALNSETAKAMPLGERATETVADLKAAGSETISTTQAIKAAAVTMAGVSGATGAVQQSAAPVDLIAETKNVATEVASWKGIVALIQETALWATSHLWILGLVAAFAFWRWGAKIELKRLIAHRLGWDLSR